MLFALKNEVFERFGMQLATFCIEKDGAVAYEQFGRGVGPALSAYLEKKELLQDSCVYDTIVGKAAASIFVLAGVKGVYGETMSESAIALLEQHHIAVLYQNRTEQIINRRGDGLCPFEQAVLGCKTPEECLPVIQKTMQKMKNAARD